MALLLLAAFIGVPLLEIAVFIQVGGWLGLWPTLGLVVLTAVVGTWELRAQGIMTLMRAREQIDRGALPTRELFDGACLIVSGALLLTPGFVTDGVGILLLIAPVRAALRRWLARHMETRVFVDGREVHRRPPPGGGRGGRGRPGRGPIIEGDYSEVSEDGEPPDEAEPEEEPRLRDRRSRAP